MTGLFLFGILGIAVEPPLRILRPDRRGLRGGDGGRYPALESLALLTPGNLLVTLARRSRNGRKRRALYTPGREFFGET
jgi:hypothetical protein